MPESSQIEFKVGQVWRIFFHKDHVTNRTIHIRAIVDEDQIVSMRYRKGHWTYTIQDVEYYRLLIEDGHMKLTKDVK